MKNKELIEKMLAKHFEKTDSTFYGIEGFFHGTGSFMEYKVIKLNKKEFDDISSNAMFVKKVKITKKEYDETRRNI